MRARKDKPKEDPVKDLVTAFRGANGVYRRALMLRVLHLSEVERNAVVGQACLELKALGVRIIG